MAPGDTIGFHSVVAKAPVGPPPCGGRPKSGQPSGRPSKGPRVTRYRLAVRVDVAVVTVNMVVGIVFVVTMFVVVVTGFPVVWMVVVLHMCFGGFL